MKTVWIYHPLYYIIMMAMMMMMEKMVTTDGKKICVWRGNGIMNSIYLFFLFFHSFSMFSFHISVPWAQNIIFLKGGFHNAYIQFMKYIFAFYTLVKISISFLNVFVDIFIFFFHDTTMFSSYLFAPLFQLKIMNNIIYFLTLKNCIYFFNSHIHEYIFKFLRMADWIFMNLGNV